MVLLSYERRLSVTKMDILIIHVNVMIIILQYYHKQASKIRVLIGDIHKTYRHILYLIPYIALLCRCSAEIPLLVLVINK